MGSLLDINVLISLFDADHIFNESAHCWLEAQNFEKIATCVLTENGLVRILSHPSYSKKITLTPSEVIQRLRAFVKTQDHCFLDDDISLTDIKHFDSDLILGSKQITDIYLLALAIRHEMKFATFDTSTNLNAVVGANKASLEIIPVQK